MSLLCIGNRHPSIHPSRLTTHGKRFFQWNDTFPTLRIAARIKMPDRSGAWPAFWMLPEYQFNRYGGW